MKKHYLPLLLVTVAIAGTVLAADSIDVMLKRIFGADRMPVAPPSALTSYALVGKNNEVAIRAWNGTATFDHGAAATGSTAFDLSGSTGAFTTPKADVAIPYPANGGNLGASNTLTAGINMTVLPFGTFTNGSTETTSWMDDTPAAEFSAVGGTADPTDTEDADFARIGTKSLKLAWPSTSVAGDGVTASITSDNLEANESVGMWIYSSDPLTAGDLTLVLTDDGGARTFNIPAVATVNKWTWVEVDISSLTGGTGDAVTAYAFKLSTAGAAAHTAFTTYIDAVYKWDAADEIALGVDVLDQPGSIRGILTQTKADAGTTAHTMAALAEQTDYFIARRSGNDSIVTITDQSAKSGFGIVLHK